MIQIVGTIVFAIGILGLFALARDESRTSRALWIPAIWVFLAGSRPVSIWLHIQQIGSSADAQLEGSPLDRNIFIFLIVVAILVLVARGPKVAKLLRANLPILLLLCYCALSIFWSDFPDVAFKRWIRAIGDILMVLVVLTDPDPPAAVNRLFTRTGFIIVPLSILFDIGRGYSGEEGKYYIGITMGKNILGMICMVVGVAAAWRFFTTLRLAKFKGRTGRLIAHGSIAAMALWLMRMADSTTATGCFILGSTIVAVMTWSSLARRPAVVHIMVAAVVVFTTYVLILSPNAEIISSMGRDPSLTGRTDVWHTVIGMNPNPLFGAGYESFWLGPRLKKLWTIYAWNPNEAHNGYIEVYLNLGWVGLIMLTVALLTGYGKLVRGLRLDTNMASLGLAYFVMTIVYNLTEAGFRVFNPVWITLLLAIIGAPRPLAQQHGERWQAGSTERWPEKPSQVLAMSGAAYPIRGERGC